MVRMSLDQVQEIMRNPLQIRNMSVIAHVDHGKSTLTDSLVSKAGLMAERNAGEMRFTDNRPDEKDRCITIKSTGVSLAYEHDVHDGKGLQHFLINLIDSPGHVDFSSEVTAALRVTDGALVVVDAVEGVSVQTETVLRQALSERVKPVVHINKVDRSILELKKSSEAAYASFNKILGDVNTIIQIYKDDSTEDWTVSPENLTVSFGSGLQGWAFTLDMFAAMYAKKFGVDQSKMVSRLWGNNHFISDKKKWVKLDDSVTAEEKLEKGAVRGFCQFVMEPIITMFEAIMNDNKEKYTKLFELAGIQLKGEDKELQGKALLKRVMQIWLNAGDCLLTLIVNKLPCPSVAQKYRVETIYSGPLDDEGAAAIRNCDPKGPLILYVSKMVPATGEKRFYAFGRVFSGTVYTGLKVRIQGPCHEFGTKTDLFEDRPIQRTYLMRGGQADAVESVCAGNTVALQGVDQYIVKTCTITTAAIHNIRDMKYSVSPVVRVAVKPKFAADLPKLVEGMKKLAKSDPLVVCSVGEGGEHVIAGCGELHMEICLKDLEGTYCGVPLIKSDPVVQYRETVTALSQQRCMSKSPNKHNRLYMMAEPLGNDLSTMIETGKVSPKVDVITRTKILVEQFDWEKNICAKIWFFGPETTGPNLFVDTTVGIQYLNEIKDHCNTAFQWVTQEGVLGEENLRGCRFNLIDVNMHADAIHRGAGQITAPCRRVLYAAQMSASARFLEPVFLVQITCPQDAVSGIYSTLNIRRGHVSTVIPRFGTPLVEVNGYLPVAESFGFTSALRQNTSGQAFPQCVFDHYAEVSGDPLDPTSKANALLLKIRKRKGIKEETPVFEDYNDKL